MALGNRVPTGIWAILLWYIGLYAMLCLHHDRTPLWPKRHLKYQLWRRILFWTAAFPVLVLAMIVASHHRFDDDESAIGGFVINVLLAVLYISIAGVLNMIGFLNYLVGTHLFTSRRAKRVNDDNGCKDVEKRSITNLWSEKDTDSGPSKVSEIQYSDPVCLEPGPFEPILAPPENPGSIFVLILYLGVIMIPTVVLDSFVVSLWAATPSLKALADTWFSGVLPIIIIIISLLAASIRYMAELFCALDGSGVSGAWDAVGRALAFFLFYHILASAAAAQGILAHVTGSVYGGIPVLDASDGPRGYVFFIGTVVSYLWPLFAF